MASREHDPRSAGRSWLSELFFEQKVGAPFSEFAVTPESRAPADSGASRNELLGALSGAEPPRTFAEYRVLLGELFDTKRDRLVAQLRAQPVFGAAQGAWNARQSLMNATIARELVPYVVKAMQEVYDFSAPPIEFAQAAGFWGTYDMKRHKITLTPQLFAQSLQDFLDTLVHEEIHSLQADMMLMLNVQRKGRVLTHPERVIAQYWKNEEPKYRSALAAGSSMSPQTRRRYQLIGQEYHAWTTGHYVAIRLLAT